MTGFWVDSTTSTATVCTTAIIWDEWINATNCTATTAWADWITFSAVNSTDTFVTNTPQRQLSQEELAAAVESQRAYEEQRTAEVKRYEEAKVRAEGLLYEHLTDDQRAQLRRDKFFVVQGGKTGKRYKINTSGYTGNVHELDDKGEVRRRLCAHISHSINAPVPDHYLAQKMMLEHSEEEFLRVANDHGR